MWQVKHPPDYPSPWNVATDQDAYDSEDQLIARVEHKEIMDID